MSFLAVGKGNMPGSGGLSATLSGLGYAALDATPTGTVARFDCATSSWASGTSATCLASSATQTTTTVATVTVATVSGTSAGLFTFDGQIQLCRNAACSLKCCFDPSDILKGNELRTTQHQ